MNIGSLFIALAFVFALFAFQAAKIRNPKRYSAWFSLSMACLIFGLTVQFNDAIHVLPE